MQEKSQGYFFIHKQPEHKVLLGAKSINTIKKEKCGLTYLQSVCLQNIKSKCLQLLAKINVPCDCGNKR